MGTRRHTFLAQLVLPTLLPRRDQVKDFALTQVDIRLELLTVPRGLQWMANFPASLEEFKNFVGNISFYIGISPPCQRGGNPLEWCSNLFHGLG